MLENKVLEAEESLLSLIEDKKLAIEITRNEFPIKAKIKNRKIDENQLSMIENKEKIYNGYIEFIFEDELIMKIEDFKIEDEILNKIKNKLKKWHYAHLEYFFERYMDSENYFEDKVAEYEKN